MNLHHFQLKHINTQKTRKTNSTIQILKSSSLYSKSNKSQTTINSSIKKIKLYTNFKTKLISNNLIAHFFSLIFFGAVSTFLSPTQIFFSKTKPITLKKLNFKQKMEKSKFKDDGFSKSGIGREKIEFQHPSIFRSVVNTKTEMKLNSTLNFNYQI